MVRAIGALALLAAVILGVPYLLVALVGNPFPSAMPSVDEVRILLTQNGDGFANFIVGALATLVWVLWAQLVVALIVEVAASVRQTEARRVPVLPGVQRLAARMVAMVTLAATLTAAPVLAPAVGALTFGDTITNATTATTAVMAMESAGEPAGGSIISPIRPAPESDAVVPEINPQHATSLIVHEHTELWDLADAAYGDGVSWKLIASSNAGFSDAAGVMITNESETVAPGTELILPEPVNAEATAAFGALAQPDGESEPGDGVHIVEPGESMWTIAEAEVERRSEAATDVAAYWTEVVDANQDVLSGDVDLIYPGERLVLPGAADGAASLEPQPVRESAPALDDVAEAEAPVVPEAQPRAVPHSNAVAEEAVEPDPQADLEPDERSPSESPSADTAAPATGTQASPEGESSADHHPAGAFGLAAFGAAILSAGIVGAVRRRRDLQRRTRPMHTIARPAWTEAAAFEAALVHASEQVRTARHGVGWTVVPAAVVNAMRTTGPLEIHESEAGDIAAVSTTNTGSAWTARRVDLVPDVENTVAATRTAADPSVDTAQGPAAPTTVVVGTDPASEEAVLLDLASAGTVALEGDASLVRRFARSLILDLAVSDRADDLQVIAVGVGSEIEDLERVQAVSSFGEAHEAFLRSGHAGPDSATPVVVVADSVNDDLGDPDGALRSLVELGVVVVAPGLDAEVSVVIDGETATIKPSGTSVVLAALADDEYRCVAELVDSTSPTALEMADPNVAVEDTLGVLHSAVCGTEPGPIDVKVLGPVEITGAEPFSSLKAVDVVTYLAFHRNGVDADQIKSWVWPPFAPPTDKALANVMSRARTGLGAADDGSPYLSRAGTDKTYRLDAAVTTDFDRFRAIVEAADDSPNDAATLLLLRQALELIRGVPFTGGSASSFAWADNHVRAQVEYTIDETVHRCADLALEVGDLATARWAALKGLELVPGCEQCFKRRFLVAGAGNNRSELRRAMADLEASAMAELGEPEAVDMISGDLLELYNELDQALVAGSA